MGTGNYYWAKTTSAGEPGTSVEEHGVDAAEVAALLLGLLPEEARELFPAGVCTLVALHDLGKISCNFQLKCPAWDGVDDSGESVRGRAGMYTAELTAHPIFSEWGLRRCYRERGCGDFRFWPACAGAHHGFWSEWNTSRMRKQYGVPPSWEVDMMELVRAMEARYGPLPMPPPSDGDVSAQRNFQKLVTGLMIVADWIASNEHCFPVVRGARDSAKLARRALERIGLLPLRHPDRGLSWRVLFPHGSVPRPMQRYMWELAARRGVYVVEDAMGGGKTEAALALAYHLLERGEACGVYFALPTQTTSNRIFFRVRDFLQRSGVEVNEQTLHLAHAHSWLMRDALFSGCSLCREDRKFRDEQDSSRELHHWLASSKRALLTPFGVGTVDQALMGVVAVRHSDVRRFALAGKVVILDEVHSYDVYTGSLITELIRCLERNGASVIILSATLTRLRTEELLGYAPVADGGALHEALREYPLVSGRSEEGFFCRSFPPAMQRSYVVEAGEYTEEELVMQALYRAGQGQCVLWIRNTVGEAQRTYRALMGERCEDGPEIGLLHARFPLWRREELEACWIDRLGRGACNRPHGCVLVATQVVEQSIDIDADVLITDLAPTDMLLQRMGRLWRHERPVAERHGAEPLMMLVFPPGWKSALDADDPRAFAAALGGSGKVYSPYVLLRTGLLWAAVRELLLPKDIRPLIEETYREEVPGSGIARESYDDLVRVRDSMQRQAALNINSKAGTARDLEGCRTRYGGIETADVLLLRRVPQAGPGGQWLFTPLHGDAFTVQEFSWDFRCAKAIATNVVRVPLWMLRDASPDPHLSHYGTGRIFCLIVLDTEQALVYPHSITNLCWSATTGIETTTLFHRPNNEPEFPDESEFMY